MTDIVERLRKPAPSPLAYDEREAFMMNERERHEAADEIERLTAALDACADYGDKQVTEIKRLNEALEEYGDHKFECGMVHTWQCSCGYTAVLRKAP